MDNAPHFDNPDQFDHKRIRLADIDGSGTTDIIYLHRDGVRLYFNQSGNGWSAPQALRVSPRVDDLVSVVPTDLLGNGTACLVWSSPLPGDARRQMRYVDLMGGQKPHLLVKTVNNLGAETRVQYAPSTKFYLQDKRDGKPWITKLPFPVHVVERVETFDHISRNRFVTRHAYHHGYFDGEEREFRGFGMVEQWDTEQLAALTGSAAFPVGDNVAAESHVPPVHTKTWFHTGVYLGRDHVSDFYAGLLNAADKGEYFREPGLTNAEARALLLPDTVLPLDLTSPEEREACRSLKGAMLRQEVYALDGSAKEPYPYTVTEQSFSIRPLQPQGGNRHAVFFTHAREAINFHYERNPADPRIQHALTLEVDACGNVLKAAAIGYGRRATIRVVDALGQVQELANPGLNALAAPDQEKQTSLLATYTENLVTNAVETADSHRNPLPCEVRTFELTGYVPSGSAGRFQPSDLVESDPNAAGRLRHIFFKEIAYEETATGAQRRRPIEWVRTLYRKDDLTGILPLGQLESLGFPGESYKLAFTPGLLVQVFQRPHTGQPPESLLPNSPAVLGGQAGDRGGYVQSQELKTDGRFPNTDPDDHWWVPSGRSFFSTNPADSPATELAIAEKDFFLPRRYRNPFGQDTSVSFDAANLLMVETRDALGNRVTVEANDYRVLQPRLVSDANRNQTAVALDVLGMVVGTAVMGKPLPAPVEGDSLDGFVADLTTAQIGGFHDGADPHASASALLQDATTRIVYDLDRFQRTQRASLKDPTKWLPPYAATLARETHASDPLPPQGLKIQIGFSYSDGFGREIQKKIQAEPGPVVEGGPVVTPRWVGSGWTIFNNKGKPVRQYEPFFSAIHRFEFGTKVGVSPVLFYDPAERVVSTLHPNHTWEKVLFDPWRQETWDVSDTVLEADPKIDPDVGDFFKRLPNADYLPGWHAQRAGGALGPNEQEAARKAAIHARTPAVAHADSLGRPFLTVAHNKLKYTDTPPAALPVEEFHSTRVVFDIEGNQRAVINAKDRVVMRYDNDMLGNRIHQESMEAGARWMLNDVAGRPLYAWDSRDHRFRSEYDVLRRPTDSLLQEGASAELLIGRTVYGEIKPNPEASNLRGKVLQLFDQAGVVTSDVYDFKGNLLRSQRQLAQAYSTTLVWSAAVPLDAPVYTGRTRYDALNRPIQVIAPHSDQPGFTVNIIQPVYNEANLLDQVHAWLNANAEPAGRLATGTADLHAVTNIDYDAKGQRRLIEFGNGARTTYTYDPLTFRLVSLRTQRAADVLQDLHYTYDPSGNITQIRDDAQQTLYFKNTRVEPSAEYTYDALHRLIEASGREHLGQAGGSPIPHSYNDATRVGVPHPGDRNAMGWYLERYVYDAAGNFATMKHIGTDPANPGWERTYIYGESSLIEAGKQSNRLTVTFTNPTEREIYSTGGDGYDAHGNMLRMPQLQEMRWDFKDQLRMTQRQKVNASDVDGAQHQGERTWYVYDASGQRVRKVTELATGAVKDERIYLGGFEIFRKHGADALVRETLHIMDDKQRVALVETRTEGREAGVPPQLIRFQFGNHLGSASLELDEQARIISYEEYTPYGSTSYQAVSSRTETPKRYRYTGKERDEESGLSYHGARYCATWLGRWTRCDPISIAGGINLYSYVRGNPVIYSDPTGTQEALSTDEKSWLDAHPQLAKDISMFSVAARRRVIEVGMADDKQKPASSPPAESRDSKPQVEVRAAIHESDADRELRLAMSAAERRASRQKESPNTFDLLTGSTAIAAKAADPSGMGLIKAPVAALYMASGQTVQEAQRNAGNVDAVAGIGAMLLVPGTVKAMPEVVIDSPGFTIQSEGVAQQTDYFTESIPGITPAQAALLLNKAFSRGSNVVVGGSRVRGNYKPGSDLDVGFDSLSASHAGKVKGPVTKLGPLKLEPTQIVPGNETLNIPEIQSAGEFFQRSGVRVAPDPRAGEPFEPSGSITFEPGGAIHVLGPTPYRL
jgi:RHS repeat-associated protein